MKHWRDYRLALGITANHEHIPTEYLWTVQHMLKTEEYGIIHQGDHIKSSSLNKQLWAAKGMDADKILFMDVDMKFPIHTIPQLLSNDVPIVGGQYHIKGHPYAPVAGWTNKDGINVNGDGKIWKDHYCPLPQDQLVEVDWTGMGCLLVDMECFDKIKYPCFYDEWDHDAGIRGQGHDIIICRALKEVGYKIYVDTRVDCGHRVVDYVNRPWIEAYYKSKFAKVYTDTIQDMTSETGWWEEQWYERWYKKLEKRPMVFWDWIVDKIPKGSTVGDLGCGDGGLMRKLTADNDNDCYGYDFTNASIDCLNQKELAGEVVDLRYYEPDPKIKYNTVILSHVLEHIEDEYIDRVLKTVASMTGDQAFVAVPREKIRWIEHKRLYTEELLVSQVSKFFDSVEIHLIKYTPIPGDEPQTREFNRKMEEQYSHIVAQCKSPKV